MRDAGLTHGGFYKHFASKDELLMESLSEAFQEIADRLAHAAEQSKPETAWKAIVKTYLSLEYCDHVEYGCPLTALAPELARADKAMKPQIFEELKSTCSAVAAREEVFRASLEGLGTRHEEPEGIGQPTDHIERETDRERILDLLARSAGSEDCSHVIRIHRVLARQLAQHEQRRPQWLLDVRGVEIGQQVRRPFSRRRYARCATAACAFVQNSHWLVFATNAAINSRSPTDQVEGPRIASWVTADIGPP
jgi:AcrR family transcriptional regulator